ncbi:HNH endonuclease domain protein [Leptospira weilii serovar Topaz str. LT2116]|uniref:HNH endonuclease domain protein n=1 Tax=Leptospira weilii serovar Topaz str. LT2116 TaxID=1088540 RepID=M3H2X7_9LEPT|nr:HNH endonuclease domain protein [Leptospira weilii serovar Topaz str. LT2116]
MNQFLTKIFEIYNQSRSKINPAWNWEGIKNTYERESELFENIFQRSSTNRYNFQKDLLINSLWIASNVTDSYLKRPNCYYCGLMFERADYFNGIVHIDHFNPISKTGIHSAGNIIPTCKDCNLLKSNLSDDELLTIFRTPEKFFSVKYLKSTETKKEKLKDFSALFFQRSAGGEEYRNAFKITIYDQRKHQDDMKANYRIKWQND